jgi:hypothetical protein
MCSRECSGFLVEREWLRWDGGRTAGESVTGRVAARSRPKRRRSGTIRHFGGVLMRISRPVLSRWLAWPAVARRASRAADRVRRRRRRTAASVGVLALTTPSGRHPADVYARASVVQQAARPSVSADMPQRSTGGRPLKFAIVLRANTAAKIHRTGSGLSRTDHAAAPRKDERQCAGDAVPDGQGAVRAGNTTAVGHRPPRNAQRQGALEHGRRDDQSQGQDRRQGCRRHHGVTRTASGACDFVAPVTSEGQEPKFSDAAVGAPGAAAAVSGTNWWGPSLRSCSSSTFSGR